ncbi:MAG: hypothetical protein AB9846_08545 [Tenuifilaceae bacterium]
MISLCPMILDDDKKIHYDSLLADEKVEAINKNTHKSIAKQRLMTSSFHNITISHF